MALRDPPAAPGAMAPNLAPARDGGALLTWLEPAGRAGHRLRLSRLRGAAWSEPVTVAEGPSILANWADVPSVAEAEDGVVVAHWAEKRPVGGVGAGQGYDVVLARSTDGGITWQRLGTAHHDGTASEHGFVSLIPEGNRVRAFWLDGRETISANGATTLRTALVGERIEADELLDSRVCDCCNTAGARTPTGALIAYRDRNGEEVRDISIITSAAPAGRESDRTPTDHPSAATTARGGDATTAGSGNATARRGGDATTRRDPAWTNGWSAPRSLHRDGWRIAGCPVNGPAVAAAGGTAAVAWYTYAGRRHSVRVAFSRDGGAGFAPAIEVDGPMGRRAPMGRVGVVLDRSGEALVLWMASERHEAEILIRRVSPDGRLGPIRHIARTRAERASGMPRVVAVARDQLLLAWTEVGSPSRVRAAMLPVAAVAAIGNEAARALPPASEAAGPVAGEPAPPYRVRSLAGKPVDLAGLRGRVVLLNIWATWCVPCRQELVELAALHRAREKEGLTIVAAAIDDRENRDQVAEFARQRGLPFAVWLDPDDRASALFGVHSLPTTLLIDRDGTIRWRHDAVLDLEDPEFLRALDTALLGR